MELYNDPNITSKEFLYAVMHDPKVDIVDRVKAAAALMEIEPHGPPRPSLTIQIQCISDDDMHAASWWSEWWHSASNNKDISIHCRSTSKMNSRG